MIVWYSYLNRIILLAEWKYELLWTYSIPKDFPFKRKEEKIKEETGWSKCIWKMAIKTSDIK